MSEFKDISWDNMIFEDLILLFFIFYIPYSLPEKLDTVDLIHYILGIPWFIRL